MAAAADVGRAGVVPAAVHVQVRQLQPVLPGARGRAAGRAGHHRVLPGGVAVPVRQPPLHAMTHDEEENANACTMPTEPPAVTATPRALGGLGTSRRSTP